MQSRFMAMRAALYDAAMGGSAHYAVPGPSISLIAVGEPAPDGSADVGLATDIATDRTQPRIESAQSPVTSAAAWAVASVLSERIIAHGGADLSDTATMPLPAGGRDAIAVLVAANGDKIALKTLAPADLGSVAMLDEPAESRARIAEQLRAGRDVITPTTTPPGAPEGWWVFDPSDGSIRDEMSDGRHDDAAEEGFLNRMAARMAKYWRKLGYRVCFVGGMAAAGITAASGDVAGAKTIVGAVSAIGKGAAENEKKIAGACKGVGGGIGGA
jgi:hypothetical protein